MRRSSTLPAGRDTTRRLVIGIGVAVLILGLLWFLSIFVMLVARL